MGYEGIGAEKVVVVGDNAVVCVSKDRNFQNGGKTAEGRTQRMEAHCGEMLIWWDLLVV